MKIKKKIVGGRGGGLGQRGRGRDRGQVVCERRSFWEYSHKKIGGSFGLVGGGGGGGGSGWI